MNNTIVNFSNLDLIPKLYEKIESMENEIIELRQHIKPKYDLTKRAGVVRFLNISESTLERYIKDGILRQGYHYYRELKNKKSTIIFISGAIEEFAKENQ